MNYLEYLEKGNKLNWFIKPIDIDKYKVRSSLIATLLELLKKDKYENEKTPVESNKNTSDNSSQSGNNNVVHFSNGNRNGTYSSPAGPYRISVTFK